jgi:F0F1-type ATP synthase assembly protein I
MSEPTSPQRPDSDQRRRQQFGRYSGAGFQMLVTIVLCTWGGIKLDEKLNSSPWATIGLSLFGVFVAMYQIIRAVSNDK